MRRQTSPRPQPFPKTTKKQRETASEGGRGIEHHAEELWAKFLLVYFLLCGTYLPLGLVSTHPPDPPCSPLLQRRAPPFPVALQRARVYGEALPPPAVVAILRVAAADVVLALVHALLRGCETDGESRNAFDNRFEGKGGARGGGRGRGDFSWWHSGGGTDHNRFKEVQWRRLCRYRYSSSTERPNEKLWK